MRKCLLGCTVAIAALAVSTEAWSAETAAYVDQDPAANDASTDDIIVTARRREESILKVPIAVTALTQEALRERNVTSLADLQHQAPALSSGSYNSSDALSVSIRGVGQGTNASPPGVVLYVNEVPVQTDGFGQAVVPGSGIFYDLENVQVLRGPQGTLFGRNSVGGAVLFVTQKPTNYLEGYLEGGIGNYDNRELQGALNLPIVSDKVLLRVSGKGQWRDGYTRSLGTPSYPDGIDLDNVNTKSGRLSLTIRPNERLQNDLVMTLGSSRSRGPSLSLSATDPNGLIQTFFGGAVDFVALAAQQEALGVRTIPATNTDFVDNRKYFNLNNTTSFEVSDNITLRNIFGYSTGKAEQSLDNDSSILPILDGLGLPDKVKAYSEELQLQGKSADGRLDWVVGGFYVKSPVQDFNYFRFIVFGTPNNQLLQRGETSKALYAQATYEIVPDLNLTGGIRYTWDHRYGEVRNLLPDGTCPSPPPVGTNVNCGIERDGKFKAPTWNVSLDYQATPELLVYAASRRGWRSGGFNFLDTSNSGLISFSPEKLTDGELGAKYSGRPGGVPLSLSGDVFYQKYKNIQVQQIVFSDGQTRTFFTNAAAARAYGLELEGSVSPVEGLRLGGYFNWLDFKYTDLGPSVDLSFIIDQRPKYKYGLNGDFTLPLGDNMGDLRLNASWGWTSHTGDTSQPGASIPSRGILNLGAQWRDVAGMPVDLSAYVTNATDSDKLARTVNVYGLVGIAQGSYTPPRMYGLKLRYRFGGD